MAECVKWGRTAFSFGVHDTLQQLPNNNTVKVLLTAAEKLRDVAVAHKQSLRVAVWVE